MKPGSLVRIDSSGTPLHGSIGCVVELDDSNTLWPNNCTYYKVLTFNGTTEPFRYHHLIESTDGYFENDSYFYPPR